MCAATAAIVGGVGAVAGAGAEIYGANKAAGAQTSAADTAAGVQQNEFNIANQEGAGARSLGYGSENELSQLFGSGIQINPTTGAVTQGGATTPNYSGFENSPGFQFATQLGQQSIQRQAAAGGNLYSSNTLANLGNYTQGMASQNYNNYVNQLLQSAGMGSQSATATGGQAVTTGQGVSNSITNAGNAQAAGATGTASSIAGLANNSNFLNSITSAINGGQQSVPGATTPFGTGFNQLGGNAGGFNQAAVNPTQIISSTG